MSRGSPDVSTLADWSGALGPFVARVDKALVQRDKRASKIAELVTATGGRAAQELRELDDAATRLERAFVDRWSNTTIKRYAKQLLSTSDLTVAGGSYEGAATTRAALDGMNDALRLLKTVSLPLMASSRATRFDVEAPAVRAAIAHGAAAQRTVLADLRRRVIDAVSAVHHQIHGESAAIEKLNHGMTLGPGIGEGIDSGLGRVEPGYGPLVLQAGWLIDTGPAITAFGPNGSWPGSPTPEAEYGAAAASPLFIPALLDLEVDGGLVTDSRPTINSLVLRLLALLPAGQVKLNIFDPQRLGESVKYLFGLGDSATKIIGDKIRSTSSELHELLDSVEGHITYVTQKYLAAQHKSLHEYNVAAGEVAEPYRVLVLFDYPSGFERAGGGMDHDAVAQLEKIIKAGPRCGVYTLVVGTGAGPKGLPTLTSGQPVRLDWPVRPRELASRHTPETVHAANDVDGLIRAVRSSGKAVNFATSSVMAWAPVESRHMSGSAVKTLITRLEKGLYDATAVEVSPQRVSRLAQLERDERLRKQIPPGPPVADPDDPSTWWQGDSADELVARVGRKGSSAVAEIKISSDQKHAQVLVGGSPGSGKSVFLHALITELSRTYPPDQLELHLVDLKMGVEFKAYTQSPHARVVALEAGREFGLATLQSLMDKMKTRGDLFKKHGVSEISEYRRLVTAPMPRVVAVIDEFQGLFEVDDAVGDDAARLLRQILKKGRALGVHTVLASQTIAGAPALPKDALGQIPVRIVFASADADARLLLADDNPEAVHLDRPGEGILNLSTGRKDANERFQGAYVSRQEAQTMATAIRDHAVANGIRYRPVVFDGVHEIPVTGSMWTALTTPAAANSVSVGLGMPMNLGGAVLAKLGNLLVVGPAARTAPVLLLAAAAVKTGMADVHVLDFAGLGSEFSTALEPALAPALKLPLQSFRGRQLDQALLDAADLVEQRQSARQYTERRLVVILANLERALQLDAGGDLAERLAFLLEEGPSVGVHTVASLDRPALIERRLGYAGLNHFDNRVVAQVGRDDSRLLLDDPVAEELSSEQLAFWDRVAPRPTVVRAFSAVEPARWG
jgi:S-DNA-T family DNA segregation ATPase FtsK/SpoIIIE